MDDNIKKLHQALIDDGYDDVGTEQEFRDYVSDSKNVATLYNALSEAGYDNFKDQKSLETYLSGKAPVAQKPSTPQSSGQSVSSQKKEQAEYPQEVLDAFNSPDNKPGNFKDLAQLNDEYQRGELKKPGIISQALGMMPKVDAGNIGKEQKVGGMIANMLLGDNMQVQQPAQKEASPESKEAAPVTTPTGVVNNEGLMDAKLANYIENWKLRPDKQSSYFENMVADLLADGTANSNEEAVNMVMPALHRYANRLAMDVTNQVVSSLPDDTVQDAEQSIGAQWYSHGVQDKLKQEADSMGISYDDYVAHFLKPAMVQSLVNKYGPNYRNIAEGIATRLYSHDEHVQDRLMNQDINDALSDVINKYVNPSIVEEYNKAQEAGSKAFTEGMEGSQFIPANLRLGTALGAQYEANEAKDPAKVLSGLQQKFGKLYRNPKFLNDMSNAAFKVMQRYGLNGTLSGNPKQFKPMINAAIKNELDQLEIKGMMPKGSAEYIMKTGLGNTIVGKITRKIMQTDYQNWLEDIANQQYQPGFWENVASGALTFAGDAWSYWLPGAAGGKLTKSMVAKAEGRLAGDLMAKGMERKMAERAAKVLIGKSKAEALKSGAVHGAVTFGGQSAISKPIDEIYRTGQFDENGKIYNPSVGKVIANTLGEVAKQSAVGAIMQGGTIANMVGKGRGLATNILADVGGKVVDSGIMTGHQMLERMAHDPNFKPTGKDAAESFLESMANLTAIGLPGMVGKYARFKDAREFNKKYDFTDQDIAELKRFGYDGLRDAFEKVGIGEYAVVGENAQRLDGQLTQKYMDLMNDKSVPEVLKAKMMAVVEGKRPSSFSPIVDSIIVQPMDHDGKVYLETLNKDGGIIDRKEFSSLDEAQKADKKLEYEKTLGLASVLEGEFHKEFTQEHLEGLYNKAAQKYNMGEKLTDEDKAAVYLHQNAGAIKEIMDKQQQGIILTEEEQKQVNAYRHYYDSALENSSVMREFVNTFEDSHGVERGTLRKALESKDKKYASLVESYLKELYNSIELKREMKQTMDDLYNTAHGNEQKRIEQGGVEGEKPTAPVEGSAGGQETPVSEGPFPYQGNTDVSSGQGEGVSTANSDNSSADVITSDAFVMGQNAYKNGDSEALQAIDYNSDLATGRLQRAFADNEKMPDIVANAYNEGRDMEQFVAQRASSLTPAQKEAISKYVEAMDAKKGAIDALQHADDGYGEALKEQLWPYQTKDGNIVPATLDSGKQVFLKKANEYGGAFVVVPDEQGLPTIKQVSNAEIKEVGTPVSLDEYIENAVAQQKDARAQQFISQFDGSSLKPNDQVTVAMEEGDANINMTFAGYSEDGKIVLTDGKDYLPLSKEEFAAWRKNALDNTINEHLDAEDDEREQKAVSQAEADKKQRYANGIVGLSEGQPDYSSKDTDPNVAAEYLQEQFGEDHGKLLNLVHGSRDDIETQLANKKKAAAEYQDWLDTNADLDPEKAQKVEDELSLVNEQIANLDARFKNWNTIRNSVMTPDEVKAMKEERKAEIEKAGVDKSSVLPDVDTGVRIPENSELKDKYPTQEAASGYITSERRRVYKMQEETQREIDGVDKILNQYMDGDMELSAEQLRDLNTTKAELANRQNALTADAKALKGKAESLNILYIKERAEQNKKNLEALSPKDRRKELVAKALEEEDMKAIKEIYKDASTDVMDLAPRTLEEFVSERLFPHSLNAESLAQELGSSNFRRGIGSKYDTNKFNYLLAKKGEGLTINELAKRVWEDLSSTMESGDGDGLQSMYTDQDVRNAVLDMFKTYDSVREMRNVTLLNRIAAAENELSGEEEWYEQQKEREIFEKQKEIDEYKSYIHDKELSLPSESELDYINGLEFDRMMEIEDREREYKQYVKSILPELADYDDRSNEEGYGGGSSLGSDSSRRGVDEGNSQGEEVGNGEASSKSEIREGSDSGRKGRQETGSMEPGEGSAVRGSHLPQEASFGERLKSAIAETETEPTEAQKKAGNYKKGHLSFGGYDYTVETPKGVTRSGKDEHGKPWSVTMHDTYGYILGKIGVDGDHIDMFINDDADLDSFDGNVCVVDQVNPETGEFDEHKVMYGYPDEAAAITAYAKNYSPGWKGLGKVTSVHKATFDKWLESSDRKTKPFREYAMIQHEEAKKAKEEGEMLGFPAIDKEGEPINNHIIELVKWAKEQGLEIDPTSKLNSYADLFVMCKDDFGICTLVPDEGEDINQVVYFPDSAQVIDQLGKLQEEFNAGRDLKHSSNIDSELTEGVTFYDADTAREFKDFVNKKLEKQNKFHNKLNSKTIEVPEDATEENPLGSQLDQTNLPFHRDVKEVKPSEMTEAQKVAYDAVSTMLKKAGIPVKVVSNEDMEKVAEAQGKGVVYGYTDGKEIVLNQEHLNPNTPIHEYQHLWRTAAKNMNPELIEHGDKLIMQTQLFADLKEDPNYKHLSDDEICDEAFARLTGEDGAAILEQMAKDAIKENPLDTAKELSVINKLKEWLKKFWYWTLDTFTKWKPEDIKKMTLEDIRNLVLRDLAQGVDPRTVLNEKKAKKAEDNKTMFGMHNISVDKLRKAIKQGGFAAPSMGVIDSKNGIYSGYGEITLIPKAEKIAKRTGKNIGTYAADAWTPIYPPVEKKFGGNGGDVAYDDIESVPKEMQNVTRNAINSFMDGRDANSLAYLYLHEKGKAPELVHVEGKYPKELHDEVKGILGKLNGIYNTTDEQKEKLLDLFIREVYDGNKEEFDNDIKKFIKKDEEFIKKRPNSNISKDKQLDVDWMKEHGYDYGALSRFVDGILRDAETSGKVDTNATIRAAQQYISKNGLKNDFYLWKEKLNDRYQVEEVIFAGYKADGNRKYLPNTVENAVKVMKQDGKNASVGSASFSHFVSSILKPMGTLDQIRKKKGNLTGNYEDVEKFQEKWQPVYDELADKMQPGAGAFESYGMDRLEEAATQKNPKKYAKEEYGVDLTDEDINKLNELIEAVKNDKPSIYFETKFMRPYGLDEFEKAIVPKGTSKDVIDALKKAGIDVHTYEGKEDREKVTMDAINNSEGIRFFLQDLDTEYLDAVKKGDMEKAQKLVNEAAEAAGYSTDSSYQGTSAFNGSAPWGYGYFLTKEERKEAWDNGEFEGESTLGDYINDDIDGGNLEELTNAASYRAADPMRKEAIDNVRNAIQKKSKTITMYRSVPSDVKEGSFRNGDWVTPSRAYAVDNAKLHGWGDDYNIIEQKVPVGDVWFDGNDIAEWGYGLEKDYINDTDFAYKNTKNNRKLLDAVTYDDNGEVIPLSQRFDPSKKDIRFHRVTEPEELERLNKEKTFRMYSGMQEVDGKLYSPMAAIIDGKRTDATEIGAWMRADERPDLVKGGKFQLVKTDKNPGAGEGPVRAAYNPYMHTSTSMMNDQFTGAYARGNIKVVEWEIPESEKTSGYRAEGAKDAVGLVPWHSGSVNGLLPKDRQRSVMLSRWRKAVRVVPDSEVAESIAEQLEGTGLAIPWNVVTPNQLRELAKLGVPITTEESGQQAPETKEKFMAQMEELKKEFPQAQFVDVKMTKDAFKEWGKKANVKSRLVESFEKEKARIVSEAKEKGSYMLAPNGKKSKLDAEQWATVRTANFKKWFGDWENDPENASKVVDENGEPMVVYHGRSADFNTFEKKEGVRFIMGLEDKVKAEGFFFSPDRALAEEFAGNAARHRGGKANVVPCYLNIRKPMDLTGEDYDRIYEDVTGWDYTVGMDTQDNLWGIMDEEGMADKIKEKGYDGAIFVEEVDDNYEPTKISYCALDANQIKSADKNNGEFSSRNNDIRFRFGEPYDYEKYPLGRVEPNLATKEVKIVHADANHGFKDYKEAKNWAIGNICRTYSSDETGNKGEVIINKDVVSKYVSKAARDQSDNDDVHYAVLKVLPDVIREGIEAETHPNFNKVGNARKPEYGYDNHLLIHRVYGAVDIDGVVYRVKITMKENMQDRSLPNKPYSYEVADISTKIEPLEAIDAQVQDHGSHSNDSIPGTNLLKKVEMSYDKGKKLLDESEKMGISIENQRKIADSVVNTANKLGGAEATVYSSLDDVPEEYRSEVEQGAKGWYDPETHSVHVYLPNCEDGNDAQRTVFHEKIGHEGMEVLLGGEDGVRKFANFVYRSVGKDVRGKIIDFANKYDPDWKNPDRMNVGTQEYIAHLAEEGPKTAEDFSLWTKIKHYLIKVLKKLGVRVPGLLNDKDLRYYLMKAGKALHVWDNMPQEKQEAMMKQASNAEIKDALSDGVGKGKPRQKQGESTIQYMKRVQEWRKWKNAREDKENPEPPMFYDFDKDEVGKKEWEVLNKEWRDRHHLEGEEPTGLPIRMEGEDDAAYMTRIHGYEKWKNAMNDKEDPMPDMFAFEKKKQEEVKRKYEDWLADHDLLEQQQADLNLYEGKIYPAETNPKADALEQQVMQDLAEVTSTDVSKEGAARTVKHAVIHRRKNMEEASADDAIYINDVKNRIEKMADSGAFDKLLSDYKGKLNRAEKLAEAIPYIIEAPRRLRDLAREMNATGVFDKGHIHIQPADVEAIQPFVQDLIVATEKKHTEVKNGKAVEMYDDPQAVSEAASKMAQTINANHQGEEDFVPIDGTDILSDPVLSTVKKRVAPLGVDYRILSPEMKSTIDSIRDWYNYTYDWLKDNHTLKEDAGYNVDYVNHIWDKEKSDEKAYAMYVENRQRTKSPNEKPRTISTLMEGIGLGLVPKTTDITKMMAYYSRSNIEAWANKTMLQELSGLNVIERNEDGEIVSSDALLSSTPPFNLEQYQYFEIPGVGPVWVYNVSPKQVKVKNPITGKEKVLYSEASAGDRFGVVFGTYQSSPFWKAFDTLASSAKKLELGFSGFHAGALTEVYMVQNMVEFGPKKAMANFMKYIFVDTMKNHQLPCFANPEDFQEAASHLVKFGATNDYAAADVQNMFDNMRDAMMKVQEKLKDGNKISGTVALATMPLKVATQMLSLINKGMDRVLWDFLHDGLKLATYRMRADKTKERAKKKGWTEEELSRALDEDGQFVNDMFGGQHWDVLGASHRTLRYAGRVLLSPDWNASTTRHFLALTGYGSIWNEATFENFKQYYKRLKHKELIPEDEGRRSRQISALLCYGIGFMVFYEGIANGINAAFRALDEEKERKKAEEIRKTNPNYRSMYELAYGDEGMKWYDYLMRGNSLGQQSKIFMGRYADGTEMYIRHGKQFREVPEYLFNHKGELEFPGPMVQRMIGKANPMVRMTLDDINYLSDFQASHADQEIQRKYGKTIGLLYKDALYWAPFLIPSQENKEFKAVDFFFPSSKGFSPWKAQSYFKDFILSGDMEGVVMTYQSCQRNGIDPEAQIKAAIGSVKALESAEMSDGVTSLQEAIKRFDAAKSITEKKKMRQKMKKFLSQSDYKAFTQKEALAMVQGYLNGDEDLKEMEKAESKYLMKAKAEDVTEDWRIQNVWNGTMETYQEYQRLKDVEKAKANAFKNSKTNKRLFAARKAIYAARRKMNKAKKQMDGQNDAAKLVEIRNTRKELLNTLNGME